MTTQLSTMAIVHGFAKVQAPGAQALMTEYGITDIGCQPKTMSMYGVIAWRYSFVYQII